MNETRERQREMTNNKATLLSRMMRSRGIKEKGEGRGGRRVAIGF